MSDQKDLSTLLAELDAAVAKMTPGPWSVEIDEYDTDEHNISIPEIRRTLHDSEWADVKELPRDTANAHGIVALVNAYPALREAIEQAIKTQQHMDETLRPLVEELRKAAHQARARETEACAEAARLRTECDEQAAIASNAVTKGAAYALENERLRALVAQQREECDEARARAIRWNNEHAAAEDRWVEERDALRAEVLQLRKNLLRTWAAAEVREYDLRKLVAQQREAFTKYSHHLRGCKIRPDNAIMRALAPKGVPFVPVPCSCGFDEARAVLAQEVPRE